MWRGLMSNGADQQRERVANGQDVLSRCCHRRSFLLDLQLTRTPATMDDGLLLAFSRPKLRSLMAQVTKKEDELATLRSRVGRPIISAHLLHANAPPLHTNRNMELLMRNRSTQVMVSAGGNRRDRYVGAASLIMRGGYARAGCYSIEFLECVEDGGCVLKEGILAS